MRTLRVVQAREDSHRDFGFSIPATPALSMSPSPVSVRRITARIIRAAALLALTACEQVLPTAPEIEAMDVRSAERFHYSAWIGMDSTLLYFVDGKPVSAEVSRALPAANVASIRLVREQYGVKQSELHVTTSTVAGRTKPVECDDCGQQPSNSEGGPGEIVPGAGNAVTRGWMNPRGINYVGLVIVDGQRVDLMTFMRRINEREIESLEILKGSTAEQIYSDPQAAYGALRITTWMGDGICPTELVRGQCPGREEPHGPYKRAKRPGQR